MRKLVASFTFLMLAIMAHAQLYVNGHKVVYDASSNTYIVSVPEDVFSTDYAAEITTVKDSLWTDVSVCGESVDDGCVFNDVGANKCYMLEGKRNGSDFISYVTFTFLPVIRVEGDFGYSYANGVMELVYPALTNTDEYCIKAKWRGGTTNRQDRHKRNCKVKILDDKGESMDVSLFGMRNDNDWILDAGQQDLFRLRNRIATEVWRDMESKPYYTKKETKARNYVEGQVAEVILNNRYVGIYSLTEAMDRKQMKLKKYDAMNNEFHGMIWKTVSWDNCLMTNIEEDYNNRSKWWHAYEVKYPDMDDVATTDYRPLYDAITFVVTSDDETFKLHVADYFDIPVLIDYYILLELTRARDNMGKNMYWAIYDRGESDKLTIAVWDLDRSVGSNTTSNPTPPYDVSPDEPIGIGYFYLYNRLFSLDVDDFNAKVAQRYWQLRKGVLSSESLLGRYKSYYQKLLFSGAAERETNRWSGDTDLVGKKLDFAKEIEYICEWLNRRLAYLDNSMLSEFTGVEELESDMEPRQGIYSIQGQKLTQVPLQGLYIMNGKKSVAHPY